jgi:hypothetical protein
VARNTQTPYFYGKLGWDGLHIRGKRRTLIHAARMAANVESGRGVEKSIPDIWAPKVEWRGVIVRGADDGGDIFGGIGLRNYY